MNAIDTEASRHICPPVLRNSVLHDALTNDKLRLILFPTEQCNFRCTYCYEDFEKGRMSRDTIEGIKALISHRADDLRLLNLSWFGGEPLIAYDIINEISTHAKLLSSQHGFKLTGTVTTNGYNLTPERALALSDFGVTSIQVSLDGDAAGHDATRKRIDGSGTHDRIWSRLRAFQEVHNKGGIAYKILLRLHMHPANQDSIVRLAEAIAQELKPDAFSVLLKSVGHWGSKNDHDINIYDRSSSDFDNAKEVITYKLSQFIPESSSQNVNVCYAAKPNSFTIRSDGTIGKCTVALRDPANSIGKIARTGELSLDAERMSAWLYSLSSMDLKDMACPIGRLPRLKAATVDAAVSSSQS